MEKKKKRKKRKKERKEKKTDTRVIDARDFRVLERVLGFRALGFPFPVWLLVIVVGGGTERVHQVFLLN